MIGRSRLKPRAYPLARVKRPTKQAHAGSTPATVYFNYNQYMKGCMIMGVERCDYYSEEEYEQAYEQEQQPEQEPDIVPCFKCNCQMYWEANEPEGNVCADCQNPTPGQE